MYLGRLEMYYGDDVHYASCKSSRQSTVRKTLREKAKAKDGWDRCVIRYFKGKVIFEKIGSEELTREELK